MEFLIFIVVLIVSPINFGNCADEKYRLPSYYSVKQYDIQLNVDKGVFDGTNTTYTVSVVIDFELPDTEETKSLTSIQLHAPSDRFQNVSVYAHNVFHMELYKSHALDKDTNILTIVTTDKLRVRTKYAIEFVYVGQIETDTLFGFYRSSYAVSDKETKYFIATQFEPVYARKAFPCFDEPQYKAKYEFSITYPQGYTAFFNTPLKGDPVKVGKDYETATFETTPEMSTYLLAFSVSDFDCTKTNSADKKLVYRVCSRKATTAYRKLASDYGPKILEALGTLTNINFNEHGIGKMDQLAFPDTGFGGMENYGLVTYREVGLLWSASESSNIYKQRVLTGIAHEFSHMWFGDLVTLNWWDNTFLNEGFASLFQYLTIAKIRDLNTDEKWDVLRQFVVETQQAAFLDDSSIKSLSLASSVATPTQISSKFDSITYTKGASILRMLYNIIEETNFLKGIQNYLKLFAHQNTGSSDLWTTIENATSLTKYLPKGTGLQKVMKNWIDTPGYPVVEVSANGTNVTVTQKRFLYEGKDDAKWYVPISYTVSNKVDKFKIVTPDAWLTPENDLELEDVLKDSEWIVLNNQESAYYRVNYDSGLWEKIRTVLVNNHSKIDVLNRAQIVDDLFNLAKAGEVKYSEVFNIAKYLKKETDYYPWYSAVNGFNSLLRAFATDSEITKALKTLQLDLLKDVSATVGFSNINDTDQIYTLKKVLILQQLCNLEEENCISSAKDSFNAVKNGTSINNNLKSVVYCSGLRHSDNITIDWPLLWKKFEASTLATEQTTILAALGCTVDKSVLETYLQRTINSTYGIKRQDLFTVWHSVVKSNPEGVDVALDFFIKNHKEIIKYYPGATAFISTIASAITSDTQLKKLQNFVSAKDTEESVKLVGASAIETANATIKWVSTVKEEFKDYFDISGASLKGVSNILMFIAAIVLILK